VVRPQDNSRLATTNRAVCGAKPLCNETESNGALQTRKAPSLPVSIRSTVASSSVRIQPDVRMGCQKLLSYAA